MKRVGIVNISILIINVVAGVVKYFLMSKTKHPANRYERLRVKEKIRQFGTPSNDRTGHIRRRIARETEEVKELENELSEIKVRSSETRTQSVA